MIVLVVCPTVMEACLEASFRPFLPRPNAISAQPRQAVMGSTAHMRPSRPELPVDKNLVGRGE